MRKIIIFVLIGMFIFPTMAFAIQENLTLDQVVINNDQDIEGLFPVIGTYVEYDFNFQYDYANKIFDDTLIGTIPWIEPITSTEFEHSPIGTHQFIQITVVYDDTGYNCANTLICPLPAGYTVEVEELGSTLNMIIDVGDNDGKYSYFRSIDGDSCLDNVEQIEGSITVTLTNSLLGYNVRYFYADQENEVYSLYESVDEVYPAEIFVPDNMTSYDNYVNFYIDGDSSKLVFDVNGGGSTPDSTIDYLVDSPDTIYYNSGTAATGYVGIVHLDKSLFPIWGGPKYEVWINNTLAYDTNNFTWDEWLLHSKVSGYNVPFWEEQINVGVNVISIQDADTNELINSFEILLNPKDGTEDEIDHYVEPSMAPDYTGTRTDGVLGVFTDLNLKINEFDSIVAKTLQSITGTMNGVLALFAYIFSFLPEYVWALLSFAIVMAVILRIFGR